MIEASFVEGVYRIMKKVNSAVKSFKTISLFVFVLAGLMYWVRGEAFIGFVIACITIAVFTVVNQIYMFSLNNKFRSRFLFISGLFIIMLGITLFSYATDLHTLHIKKLSEASGIVLVLNGISLIVLLLISLNQRSRDYKL